MKKMIIMVVMMLVMVMGGMPVHAAETQDDYRKVINGIEADIAEEEDEGKIISVERKEFPSEKVMMYEIYVECDGEIVKEFIYINGESQEVYALLYDSDNYMIDSRVMNLAEAAETYSE